jgi:hypothetical protein
LRRGRELIMDLDTAKGIFLGLLTLVGIGGIIDLLRK